MRPARLLLRSASLWAASNKLAWNVTPLVLRSFGRALSTTDASAEAGKDVAAAAAATEETGEDEEEYEDEEGEEAGEDELDSYDEAVIDYFTALDAADESVSAPLKALPAKVSGISGELAADLYRKNADGLESIVVDLQGLEDVIDGAPTVISRFFEHSNYSPEECALVVNLLTTDKYPKFESITNEDLREIVIGAAENFPSFLEAKAEVAELGLEKETTELLGKLATMGRLDLLTHVVRQSTELFAAESKTVLVHVSSAVALTEDQKKRIEASLPKFSGGAEVDVEYEVDPSTLGGLLITLGNQSIDLSAATQLMEAEQEYQ